MKETTLWDYLRPLLEREGKFQKISDRFTFGVPDVLGVYRGRGFALELKDFYSANGLIRADFRPGQIPFLNDWHRSGGIALVVGVYESQVYGIRPRHAGALMKGIKALGGYAACRSNVGDWRAFVHQILRVDGVLRPLREHE